MKMPWEKNNVQDPRVTNVLRWIGGVSSTLGLAILMGSWGELKSLISKFTSIENKLMIIEERTKNIAANDAQQDRVLDQVIEATQDLKVQGERFKMEIRQLRESRR